MSLLRNHVRIIAGKWRGRQIKFRAIPSLRPTPDRVRETVFNWLMPTISGAHCLELFAGSGAMGFESLSRGAASVVMVDQSRQVIQQLKLTAQLLNAHDIEILNLTLPDKLKKIPQRQFDMVFLDPPFRRDLIGPCCQALQQLGYLADHALIYIEAERELKPLPVPDHWQLLRSKTAGQLRYYLLKITK